MTGTAADPTRGGPCVFCEIVAGRPPATLVWEDADAVAFEPLNPVTDGHVLVVPRLHVADATEDPGVAADTMFLAASLAEPPCNIITSAGSEARRAIEHHDRVDASSTGSRRP